MVTKTKPTAAETNAAATIDTPEGARVVALPAVKAQPRPSDKVIAFVKKHPAITVAGGIALGVAVSALIPRKGSRRLLGKAVELAEAAGAASLLFGRQAADKAHDAGDGAMKQASLFAGKAGKASDFAVANLEKYGLAAVAAASALGRATARRAGTLGGTLGDAAADGSAKVLHKAGDIAGRLRH